LRSLRLFCFMTSRMRDLSIGLPVTAWKKCQYKVNFVGMLRSTYLHHGEMLCAVMRLEESISSPTLD
jgi:hypothetical protein